MPAQWNAHLLAAALAAGLAACSLNPADEGAPVAVHELARQAVCNSPSKATAVTLLTGSDELAAWQRGRGIALLADPTSEGGPFAVVELGAREVGGYGLLISRNAYLYRRQLSLSMSVLGEASANHPAQPSSFCVLVQLPPGDYESVAVLDASFRQRAISTQPPAPEPPAAAAPQPADTASPPAAAAEPASPPNPAQ